MPKDRNGNFELLRIISMFLIICFHCSFHGNFSGEGLNKYIINFFNMFGEIGVNCFVMISGFFYNTTILKPQKFIKLIVQVWFYVIIGICIAVLFFNQDVLQLFKIWCFPLLRDRYWFATCFILLYIFQPFIKVYMIQLTDNQMKRIVMVMLIIWSIIPSFTGHIEGRLYYNRFIWMVVIYFIGGCVKNYSENISMGKSILAFLFTWIATIIFIVLFTKLNLKTIPGNYWWPPNSVVQVALSVSLFCIVVKMEIKSNKVLSYIASCTFGIYLLHDGVLRNIIWDDIFNTYSFGSNWEVIFGILSSAVVIFLFGLILDSIYKICIKVIYSRMEYFFNIITKICKRWKV